MKKPAEVVDLKQEKIRMFLRAYFEDRSKKVEFIKQLAEDWDSFKKQAEVVVD